LFCPLVNISVAIENGHRNSDYTWWLIPLSKWVITPVISGLTLLIPFITGVITHLLTGMSHQVVDFPSYKMGGFSIAPYGQDGRSGRTCPPAMSTTFAAGTTDGPSNVDEFGQKLCMKCLENAWKNWTLGLMKGFMGHNGGLIGV